MRKGLYVNVDTVIEELDLGEKSEELKELAEIYVTEDGNIIRRI